MTFSCSGESVSAGAADFSSWEGNLVHLGIVSLGIRLRRLDT